MKNCDNLYFFRISEPFCIDKKNYIELLYNDGKMIIHDIISNTTRCSGKERINEAYRIAAKGASNVLYENIIQNNEQNDTGTFLK